MPGVVFDLHDRGTEGCAASPPQPSVTQLQLHEGHVGECLVRLPERRKVANQVHFWAVLFRRPCRPSEHRPFLPHHAPPVA
jgi:hypothetical protein